MIEGFEMGLDFVPLCTLDLGGVSATSILHVS